MSKYTPGPWMVSFDASRYGIYQCDVIDGSPYRRTPIAFVPKIASAHACDEAERRMILQDARLIAAAPDLLEALKELVGYTNKPGAWDRARAVIEAVEGEKT